MKMEGVPGSVVGGGIAIWLAREVWGVIINRKREKAESEANITLVQGLAERVKLLEEQQINNEKRIAEEIRRRMEAEEVAHELKLRIQSLESILRQLGATIPAIEKR